MSEAGPDRALAFERWFNVRDLGGLPASGGQTRVGRFYRASAPGRLLAADEPRVRAMGLRTVIDLRRDNEQRHTHPLIAFGVDHRRAVLQIGGDLDAGFDVGPNRYALTLERSSASYRQIFTWLGQEETYPAVLHCVAGTHRTAVVVALALDVLGVPREEIEADYQMSQPESVRMMRSWGDRGWFADATPEQLDEAVAMRPGAIVGFLEAVAARHGSAEAYLLGIGVTPEALSGLRRAMT